MSPKTAELVRKFKKYHKWPGIVISLFALLFAVSGILLNHRNLISNVEFSRKYMPPGYEYKNWNLSSVRSSLEAGRDSILVYGNIGAWMADKKLTGFRDFNNGFPGGIDGRKIYSIVRFKGRLVAGTHFGLYTTAEGSCNWELLPLPEGEERISDLAVKGDSLLVLTRNILVGGSDLDRMEKIAIPPPAGYEHKIGLFLTLWNLHSGELFGLAGMLFVDLLGLVLIFLTVSGLLHFLFPKWISYLKKRKKSIGKPVSLKKLNIKWHNLAGYLFAVFLVINTTAGMFLRPPLLIPISSSRVGIVPYSHLDTGNPWHDKLRRIVWNEADQSFIFYTSDGFYRADRELKNELLPIAGQPPVSIMGCNVLEPLDRGHYLVGSFSGMFIWEPATGLTLDFFSRMPAEVPKGMGRPVGQNMVAGFVRCGGQNSFWFDYNLGAKVLTGGMTFPAMPEEIHEKSPISLWNAALEVHTGRVFEHLVGPLYLLYVPIVGLSVLVVLISGFLVWWYAWRKRRA